jgi:hypothetical protein
LFNEQQWGCNVELHPFLLYKNIAKKVEKKFGGFRKILYLCIVNQA